MKYINYLLSLSVLLIFIMPITVFADGTETGYLQGVSSYGSYAPATFNLITPDETISLPYNATTFEGGAVNQTTYKCSYVGPKSKITSANCTIVSAALKGNLKSDTIVSATNSSAVVGKLPNGVEFPDGRIEGAYYICTYTGTLPDKLETAICDLNQAALPSNSEGGSAINEKPVTRLFTITGCAKGQELICWTSKVYTWSQTALLVAAVGAFVIAGIMYMTSGGNPQMIGKSKKIIVGALSGVAVIVLGRFFLTKVIGVPWL